MNRKECFLAYCSKLDRDALQTSNISITEVNALNSDICELSAETYGEISRHYVIIIIRIKYTSVT